MERLLDQADALLLAAGGAAGGATDAPAVEVPDFDIPEELVPLIQPNLESLLELKESHSKGRGYFAQQSIPAGTILMVAKPISMVLDDEILGLEDDDEENEGEGEVDDGTNDQVQDQAMETTDDGNDEKDGTFDDDNDNDNGDNEDEDGDGYNPGMMEESENPDDDEEPEGSTVNELLVLDVLQKIIENPSIWSDQISNLYPREAHDIAASPVWISKDDHTFSQFEALIRQLESVPSLQNQSANISQRLPLIVRYNVLSVETCAEMLTYPGLNGHHPLAGAGLYYWPSYFNHDARPNVSRYAVGDIMWLVTNQPIKAGDELCISYLEHDVLCENANRRNNMLTLDFQEDADTSDIVPTEHVGEGTKAGTITDNDDDDGPEFPVVDSDVQNEIMSMGDPFAQLDSIDQLMAQATGEALPEGDDDDDDNHDVNDKEDSMDAQPSPSGGGPVWFECDIQNLRILKAITLDGMDLSKEAISVWEECVKWTEAKMPPNDETSIVMRVQAALCAMHIKDEVRAKQHASIALERHNLMFGGGVRRFRRRYRQDFSLNLRPVRVVGGPSLEDLLWPYDD